MGTVLGKTMTRSTSRRRGRVTTARQLESVIAAFQGEVVLRRDLKDQASPSQLSRALKQLIGDGKLVRVGSGIYAKARPSPLSGQPVPRQTLEVLAAETFDRLGIAWKLGEAQRLYNDGLTTQVPWRTTFNTGHRLIRRRLQVGQRIVNYENNAQSR